MAKRKKAVKATGTAVVAVDLCHWANTVESYDSHLYGYPLMDLLPDVPRGHGIKLKVTVELLSAGKRCDVRRHSDGNKCSKQSRSTCR